MNSCVKAKGIFVLKWILPGQRKKERAKITLSYILHVYFSYNIINTTWNYQQFTPGDDSVFLINCLISVRHFLSLSSLLS